MAMIILERREKEKYLTQSFGKSPIYNIQSKKTECLPQSYGKSGHTNRQSKKQKAKRQHKNATKISITQSLRTDFRWLVGEATVLVPFLCG